MKTLAVSAMLFGSMLQAQPRPNCGTSSTKTCKIVITLDGRNVVHASPDIAIVNNGTTIQWAYNGPFVVMFPYNPDGSIFANPTNILFAGDAKTPVVDKAMNYTSQWGVKYFIQVTDRSGVKHLADPKVIVNSGGRHEHQ